MNKETTTLDVCELFYSLQGEGVSLGRPAVFLRLAKCNLCCGCGTLVEEGKATWTCDSQAVMKDFEVQTPAEVFERLKKLGDAAYVGVLLGEVNLVVTGGEPTVYKEGVTQFLGLIDRESVLYQQSLRIPTQSMRPPVYEIETNGTIFSGPSQFYDRFSFVNCSPKLANSGMARDKRIVPFALIEISKHPSHFFKFVVSSEKDWEEINEDFIKPGFAHPQRIFLMPAGATRDEMIANSAVVWKMAMDHHMLATTRLHIIAWDTKKSI